MANLISPTFTPVDIVGNFRQGEKYGRERSLQRQQDYDKSQLRNLAPSVVGGDIAAYDQAAAINPEAAAQYQAAGDNQVRRTQGAIQFMDQAIAKGPQAAEAAYQQVRPFLSRFGQEAPATWAEAEPKFQQAKLALSAAQASQNKNLPSGYQEFQLKTAGLSPEDRARAARIDLGLEGRASNAGYGFFEFEGSDGRKRMGRNNPRTGTREVYDETTGNFVPVGGGSEAASSTSAPATPGFGIAETDNYVKSILSKVNVDRNATPEQQAAQLLPALIQQESGGNPNAVSNKGAVGLTQVMPATGANPGFGIHPLQNNSQEENVRFGRDYLTAMLKRYPGRPDLALAAYNAGPAVADRFANSTASNAPATTSAVAGTMAQLTGRRKEDEAAAVEQAKTDVQLRNASLIAAADADAAGKKSTATTTAATAAQRQAEYISNGLAAADSLPVINRALDLLDTVGTGGIDRAKLAATNFFGVTGADEGELSQNLGKAVLSQLRSTFGAQFTEKEGERLEGIESGFGKSTAVNKRLLQQAKVIIERAARRGEQAARDSGDTFSADEIRRSIDMRMGDPSQSSQAPQPQRPAQQQSAPRQIINAEEYNSLPSGALYIAPDGSQRRKR